MSEHKTFKDKFDDTCNFKSISIQGLMLISFTVVSAVIVFVLGILFNSKCTNDYSINKAGYFTNYNKSRRLSTTDETII